MPFEVKRDIKLLNVCNPCFSRSSVAIAAALYEGGCRFDCLKSALLYRRQADDSPNYRYAREQAAEYFNYLGGIFDFFADTAFQAPPELIFTGDAGKLDYYNTLNDGLADLLQGRMLDMMVHGYGLLTTSYPATPLVAATTLGQELQAGALDAQLRYISPDVVEDWQLDQMGELLWLKVHFIEDARSVEYGKADEELHTWIYITATEKAVYQAKLKKPDHPTEEWEGKDDPKEAQRTEYTPFDGGLPVYEVSLPDRGCLMERCKRAAIRLFNSEAGYDFALDLQCYAQPTYSGPLEKNELNTKANEFAMWMGGTGGQFSYLIPQGVAFDSLRARCERQRGALTEIIRAAITSQGDKDQHAASGAAKTQDRAPAEACARLCAGKLVLGLTAAVKSIIAKRGDTNAVEFTLKGMDDFSPLALADKLANMTAFNALPASKLAKEIALRNLSQAMATGATPEEREEIENEELDVDPEPPAPVIMPAAPGAKAADDGTTPPNPFARNANAAKPTQKS